MMDKWDKRFMEMANVVSTWSSCYRTGRQVGAVITKNKRILTTGYNGAPEGIRSCVEKGECMRDIMKIPSGTARNFATPSMRNRMPSVRRRNSVFRWKAQPFIVRISRAVSAPKLSSTAA